MAVLPVLAVGIFLKFLAAVWIMAAILLVLVVLIQKGRGGGLSGAFGGGMAGGLLGSKTGDFLTWVTIGLVGAFLLLSVILAKFYVPDLKAADREAATQRQTQTSRTQTPAAATQAETPAPSSEATAPASAPSAAPTTPAPSTGATAPAATPTPAPNPPTPAPGAGATDTNKPAAR